MEKAWGGTHGAVQELNVVMKISGRHLEITPAIRQYAEEKAGKLPKYYDLIQDIEVILDGHESKQKRAEVVVIAEHKNRFIAHHEGEDLYEAALRELHEETNISSVERIGEIKDWLIYDIPRSLVGQAWKGKYRGQKQKWYAFRFTGKDSEIDVEHPAGGKHKPEFVEWRFEVLKKLPDLVVPFKREVYERVVKEFAPLTKPLGR